jgi:uncharacterized protein (DUF2384 family)
MDLKVKKPLSSSKPAKRKSSRKVDTTKVSSKAKAKSTSKAPKHAPVSRVVKPGAVGIERLARLFAHASRALGTKVEARAFMTTPHPELGGLSPQSVARTDPGIRRVENILHALEYGLAL